MISIDMGSIALNEAGWKFIDHMRSIESMDITTYHTIFSMGKPILKEAIEGYLNRMSIEEQDKLIEQIYVKRLEALLDE